MHLLVTGGAGYVGSLLVPELLAAGHRVRVLDNLMFGGQALLSNFSHPAFEFVRGDICDERVVRDCLHDVDAVIHLAAIVGYPACKKNPKLAQDVNVTGSRILNRQRSRHQPVIFASTGSNYGAVVGELCTEETPLRPLTIYGKTKTEAEQAFLDAGNVVAYRFATAFGLSPRLRLDLLINDFVYKAVKEKNLIVYEKQYKRTFIHVRDMVRSFLFALEHLDAMRDNVYNVGSEAMNYSKEQVARLIREKVDYYLHFADFGKDEDQRNYEVSYQKIRAAGFQTTVDLARGIDELIAGCRVIEVRNPYGNV